jgi:hypothetical protein
VSGRGRRAVLPPADHRVEPPLAPDGLVVTVVNKAGYGKPFDFAELAVAEPMQRSLAVAFAEQSRTWTSHGTGTSYWRKLEAFARFVSGLEDPPQDLGDLTRAMLKRWRAQHVATNTGRTTLQLVRTLLQRHPQLSSGAAAEELARRVPKPRPSKQSYEDADRERVLLAAQRHFRSVLMRIRENTELLESWRAGQLPAGSRDERIGRILEHLSLTGDVPRTLVPSGQRYVTNHRLLGGHRAEFTWGRLFLSRRDRAALAVLLTDRFAWNLSVYDRMPAPTKMPSIGETTTVTYQVQVEKRRAGGGHWFSTENITDSGADSPGRLITQALEATAHGRRLAALLKPGTDLLMTARDHRLDPKNEKELDRPRPVGPLVFGVSTDDAQAWAKSHQLGGSPIQRGRRTTVTREGRPLQHSQGTHESVYVLPDQRVQRASQSVFEDGAHEAWEQAQNIVFNGHIGQTANPDHQETATADCEDEATSPWPAPGGGCGADFLLCLACENAHVHPGHHARLAYLHQRLQSLRSALPDAAWNENWHDSFLRLEDLRNDNKKIGPDTWKAALARVTDADRAIVDLLLEGSLAP